MENVYLFYALKGASILIYASICIRMFYRLFKTQKYTPWQRRLYFHWGISIFYILLLKLYKIYIINLTPDGTTPELQNAYIWSLPSIPLLLLTMLCLTSHRLIRFSLVAIHILIVFVWTYLIWFIDNDNFTLVSITLLIIYIIFAFYRSFKQIQWYHKSLYSIYANVDNRTLSWLKPQVFLFMLAFVSWTIFDYLLPQYYVLFIIISLMAALYTDWKIASIRETQLVDEDINRRVKEVQDSNKLENQNKELNSLMAQDNSQEAALLHTADGLDVKTKWRVENTLKPICLEKKLYLRKDLTVDDLALEVDTTREYITNYFETRNTTFLQYINNLRIEHAMRLLLKTDKSIPEIMDESGFCDRNSFDHYIKNRYGHTSTEIRKQYKIQTSKN